MPGVFTHGDFDTWSPGYLMFMAATHNGISRLYETFGNGGADTEMRDARSRRVRRAPGTARTRRCRGSTWSQRNNNNYQQTGLLVSLALLRGEPRRNCLRNFYLKSKRSIEKPGARGPGRLRPSRATTARPGAQAELLRVLQLPGRRDLARRPPPSTVPMPSAQDGKKDDGDDGRRQGRGRRPPKAEGARRRGTFPAGSYVVRMDQPYSRIADVLLDHQYWSPDDPQKHPYDDTGWTFGELFGVQVARVTDPAVLAVAGERVSGEVDGRVPACEGSRSRPRRQPQRRRRAGRPPLSRSKAASFEAAEEPFEAAGTKFARGSFLIRGVSGRRGGRRSRTSWASGCTPWPPRPP